MADLITMRGFVSVSRGPSTFRQRDLDRAILVAQQRGLTDYEVIIEGARVILRVASSPLVPVRTVADSEDIVV
jgi:hypothetical protein